MTKTILHPINARDLTTYKPIDQELQLNPNQSYLFDLSYLTVLTVEGEKAAEFLQGQLTCDLSLLSEQQMVQGLQCNLQGRILTCMDVIQWQGVKLVIPMDLAEQTVHSLQKVAMLSRVNIQKNDTFCVFGMYLPHENKPIHRVSPTSHYCTYHLDQQFYMAIVAKSHQDEFIASINQPVQYAGSLTWHTLQLQNKHVEIYPNTRGVFIPHRLGLHQTPLISFNKGCYKGQEIIARLHYKSTIKHHLQLFTLSTDQPIFSGQKLFDDDKKNEVGEVVDYSLLGDNQYLVAVSILKQAGKRVFFENHVESIETKQMAKSHLEGLRSLLSD